MRSIALLTIFELITITTAATPCQKDACYSAVAVQGPKSPNLASRRADCSSILKTVIDDSTTKTITRFLTAETPVTITVSLTETATTVVTTTDTALAPVNKRAQSTGVPSAGENDSLLEARDQIIIKGNKPAYASACKTNQDYAVACLCFGIKAGVQRTVTQTRMVTSTITQTATATTSVTVVETSTTVLPCSSDLQTDASNCGACGIVCSSSQPRCRAGRCVEDQCRTAVNDACAFGTCPSSTDNGCVGGDCFDTDVGNRCIAPSYCGEFPTCNDNSANCPSGRVCVSASSCCGVSTCLVDLPCPAIGATSRRRMFGRPEGTFVGGNALGRADSLIEWE